MIGMYGSQVAEVIIEGGDPAEVVGLNAQCLLFSQLPYVDASLLFIQPFCHAYLYGALKDFVHAMLKPRPKASKPRANAAAAAQPPAGLGGGAGLTRNGGGAAAAARPRPNRRGEAGPSGAGAAPPGGAPAAGAVLFRNENIILSSEAKRIIAARGGNFVTNRNMNRPMRCPLTQSHNYQMEGWMNFLLVSDGG